MDWRREGAGPWRVAGWTALDHVRSAARRPVFTEVTGEALGGNVSFRRQLVPRLDDWLSVLDSAFLKDSMGHHGVSAGDADGDGLDDLYVSQPAALPNRLFRNRGDGTFEDVTEAAGMAVLDDTAQSLFADVDNDGDQDLVLVTSGGLLEFANDGSGRFARVPDAFRLQGTLRGSPMAISMADYDRDGFLDVYLCTYSYFIGAGEDKGGTPVPYYDARNGPPDVLFRNDGHGRFVDVTAEAGLGEGNDRYGFAAAWADYDDDGWPDLLVANDFGRKNLYRNQGRKDGKVTFRHVTAEAGVEDHGAGMSAAWLDYDNDGRLDIYTGNMWSAAGQRVTARPAFLPDAPPEVRALYRRHARGNTLLRNRGDGTFEDVTLAARAEMGRWAWSSDALDFDSDGCSRPLRGQRHVHAGRGRGRPRRLLLAAGRGAVAGHPGHRHPLRRRLAGHQPAPRPRLPGEPPAERVPAQRRPRRLRRRLRHPRPRPGPGRPVLRGARLRPRRRRRPGGDGRPLVAAAPDLPQRLRGPGRRPHPAPRGHGEQP